MITKEQEEKALSGEDVQGHGCDIDCELIECVQCKKILNGAAIWITSIEAYVLCEECYQLLRCEETWEM